MYSLEELDKLIKNRTIPDDAQISLKLYCDYYEKYIENSKFVVETTNGDVIDLKIKANQVAHIMGLHAFHDKTIRNKRLMFPGSFAKIDGYANIKKGNITLELLKKSNGGRVWKRDTSRDRVLSFPFVREALLHGDWFNYDPSKSNSKIKMKYLVSLAVNKIFVNFCVDYSELDGYYCVSNAIAYNSNGRTRNQTKIEMFRALEYSGCVPIKVVCRDRLISSKLQNRRMTESNSIARGIHNKLIEKKLKFNSELCNMHSGNHYVTFLQIDSNIKKHLKTTN